MYWIAWYFMLIYTNSISKCPYHFSESQFKFLLKLLLFMGAIQFCVLYQFEQIYSKYCSLDLYSNGGRTVLILWSACLCIVVGILLLEIINSSFNVAILGKHYVAIFMFHVSMVLCFIYTMIRNDTEVNYNTIIMTSFFNLFLSLSDSTLCGKYIFIAMGALRLRARNLSHFQEVSVFWSKCM